MAGAPAPASHAAIAELVQKFADGLFNHATSDELQALFADDGSWTDPVGDAPHEGKEQIKERISKLPPMDHVRVLEIFYSMTDKVFLAKTEVKFTPKPNAFTIVDRFVVNEDMKITVAEAHFHPFQLGAPRPESHAAIEAFAKEYVAALHNKRDALLGMFATTDEVSWTDPAGTPPHVGHAGIAERIAKLPAMEYVKLQEVVYTKDDKIFLLKVEIKFADKERPFVVVDRVVLA